MKTPELFLPDLFLLIYVIFYCTHAFMSFRYGGK